MDKIRILTYSCCLCCGKTFSLNDLIEVSSNSLIIGDQTLDICDLFLELFLVKIELGKESYICFECKDYLVQFHIFKKNIQRYESFEKIISISNLFSKLDTILQKLDTSDLKIVNYSEDKILIDTSKRQQKNIDIVPILPEIEVLQSEIADAKLEDTDKDYVELSEPRKKRKTEAPARFDSYTTDMKKPRKIVGEIVDCKQASHQDELETSQTSSSQRWNTNSSLTEEQKNWIWEDARKSEVKENGRSVWKCSVCRSKISSSWVLRKHLRDVHIIKPNKKTHEKKRGKDFMNEVRNSKNTHDLEGRQETFWQCKRCDNTHKSESGFIKHLLYQHINSTTIDPTFIAKCKIEIEYEDKSKGPECGWSCPECKKFYRSPVGLKNHFKLSHSDIDFGGEKYLQKVQEIAERTKIIKEEEKECEIVLDTEKGLKKIWECKRCPQPRYFRSESGFKTHMRISHLTSRRIDESKIADCRQISEESGAKLKIWKCPICSIATKTKEGFISHVSQEHSGEFDEEEESNNPLKPSQTPQKTAKPDVLILQKLAIQVSNERGGALKADGYKFSCNECGLFFSKHYKTHVEAHKTLKRLTNCYHLPNCQECRVIYCNDEAMMKHLEWHVEGSEILPAFPSTGVAYFGGKEFKPPTGSADDAVDESTWKCGHCLAMFWNEDEVVEHMLMLHMSTLTCPVDHLEFFGNRGLAQFCLHMKNKHPEIFPDLKFPCTYCKTEFSTVYDKLAHMKVCNEKKLVCDGCGKKFFSKIKLAHHLRIEKGILQYSCSFCGKDNFKNSMDLKLHVLGMHTSSRNFSCTFCDKTFKNSAARSSHMETHSDISLKCSFCDATFKKRIILARHIKTIHNEAYRDECFNEFSCKLCNKSFLRRINFKNHLKNVHNIIEEVQEV